MSIHILRRPNVDIKQLPDSLSPLMRRIYIARGIQSLEQLENSAKRLHSFQSMHGISLAVSLLFEAIKHNKRIIVVGDFDADGATSSALSVIALRMLGCLNVDYLVPNRFDNGYGLSVDVVDQAIAKGADVIMTVDNGVSSIDGVRYAKQKGLTVIVTDHHLPGDELPNADAMVNPNLQQCEFPSKSLAGVGVAFYLMLALRAHMREQDWFTQSNQPISEPNLAELLDLVALGTVADVVSLDDNNRILVHQGLQRIRAGKARPGIQALIEVSNRQAHRLVAADFGFALAPRINAAGRLDDMAYGVELLLCDDIYNARKMANELDALNQTRREIEQGMKAEAMKLCDDLLSQTLDKSSLPFGLTLYQQDWHQGVIGIVASRIKDEFHRPVIVFAAGGENEQGEAVIKGSCRSIAGLHIRDCLDRIDTQNPNLIKSFGGHAMAAGLTIKLADYQQFSEKFDQAVRDEIDESALTGTLLSDGELAENEFILATAEQIRAGGPWGQSFPEPLFDGQFKVLNQKLVAEKHLKLMLAPVYDGQVSNVMVDAIAFNVDLSQWPNTHAEYVRLAYRLDINEFRGNQSLQLIVNHLELS